MSSIDERREKLQEISRGALITLADLLDAKTRDLVSDFIDNYEFGVALDWMCGALEDQAQALTDDQKRKLKEVADALNASLPIWIQQ